MKNKKCFKILVSFFAILVIIGCIAACSKSEENNDNKVAFQEQVEMQDDNMKQQEETDLVGMEDEDQEESFESDEKEDVTNTTGKEENTESIVNTPSKETTTSSIKKEENKKPSTSQSSTDKKPSENTSKEPEKTQTHSHTHSWQEVKTVVKHEETGHYEDVLVKEAWTEEKPVYETVCLSICNGCGLDITGNPSKHIKEQALSGNFKCGGHHTEYVKKQIGIETIQHDAVYEQQWVEHKEAWTETVISYKCSCGATK